MKSLFKRERQRKRDRQIALEKGGLLLVSVCLTSVVAAVDPVIPLPFVKRVWMMFAFLLICPNPQV